MQLNLQVILFQCLLLAIQCILYFLVQLSKRPVHDVERAIDGKIPLMPSFTIAYVLWYPLIAIFPLFLYHFDSADGNLYEGYILGIMINIAVSMTIYWFYPTSFNRPSVQGAGLCAKLLQCVYIVDSKALNCMPSMHCSMCYMILYYSLVCGGMGGWQYFFGGMALLIPLSTLFTKQHMVIDAITALPLAVVCVLAGSLI